MDIERKWQPTPVFLPWKFHGQRSLVSYSPWGWKELDRTEHSPTHAGCIMYCASLPWEYATAAAAKSLQSCPTLCDPIDGSPPGSPVPGILQEKNTENRSSVKSGNFVLLYLEVTKRTDSLYIYIDIDIDIDISLYIDIYIYVFIYRYI